MSASLLLAVTVVLILIVSVVRLPPLHPVQLWAAPWAVAVVLYQLRFFPYRALSWQTSLLASGAALAFSAGALLTSDLRATPVVPEPTRHPEARLSRSTWLLAGATLLLLGLFLTQAVTTVGFHSTFISPSNLRAAIQHGDFVISIKYVYCALATCGCAALTAAQASSGRLRAQWLLVTAFAIGSLYLATGRSTVVSGVIVAATAYSLGRAPLSRRRLLISAGALAAVVIIVFLAGGVLIGKTYAHNPQVQSTPSTFTRHRWLDSMALPYEYASAPIAALEVQNEAATALGDGHGCAILHPLCTGLADLGFHVPYIPTIRPFTAAPLPWNTFTALDLPLIDFGKLFLIPIFALVGCACGAVWRRARRYGALAIITYALLSVALLTSSGSFNFLAPQLVGALFLTSVCMWLVTHVSVKRFVRKVRRAHHGVEIGTSE